MYIAPFSSICVAIFLSPESHTVALFPFRIPAFASIVGAMHIPAIIFPFSYASFIILWAVVSFWYIVAPIPPMNTIASNSSVFTSSNASVASAVFPSGFPVHVPFVLEAIMHSFPFSSSAFFVSNSSSSLKSCGAIISSAFPILSPFFKFYFQDYVFYFFKSVFYAVVFSSYCQVSPV